MLERKQVLRINTPMNNDIVRIESSNSIIVDNKFYTEQFGDMSQVLFTQNKTYPVKLVALQFDWFFKEYDDKRMFKFLRELINHEDINIYKIPTI